MREEILLAEEGTLPTEHEKIFVARLGSEPETLLQDLVSTYRPEPGAMGDEALAELLEAPPDRAGR
jgi:hypothetical protein